MSHHHMLPPIAYTPEPRPKKIETRKRRIGVGGTEAFDEMDETGGTQAFGPAIPTGGKPAMPNFTPIESSDQKPQHPRGRLSESTLKVMLQAQELE
jgi:hypothetical protein